MMEQEITWARECLAPVLRQIRGYSAQDRIICVSLWWAMIAAAVEGGDKAREAVVAWSTAMHIAACRVWQN